MRRLLYCAALVGALSQSVSAAITYTDATFGAAGNTSVFDSGSASYVALTPSGSASGTDGLWRLRAFGNGGSILESGGDTGNGGTNNSENAARLRTVVSGLIAGQTYDVYAYYWDASTGNWDIQAGLIDVAGDMSVFTDAAPGTQVTDGSAFDVAPIFAEGDRALWQASLGTAVADAGGTISIFIDDNPTVNSQASRSWYDGVGVAAVPEPTSALVLTGMGLAFSFTRRRKAA